jgi:hypothetical protein
VGHSLGAGIAMMAACYFLIEPQYQSVWSNPNLNHKLRVVTVGGPRACCQSMQQQVDGVLRTLRKTDKVQVAQLTRDKDVVPTVPPELFGFRHLQQKMVYITKEDPATGVGHVIINPDLRQVIRKKKLNQLIQQNPYVLAPQIPYIEGPISGTEDANEDNDDIESSSDEEGQAESDTNMASSGNVDDRLNEDDPATLTEAEWLARYEKKVKLIPRAFRDHMPDFYLKPLLQRLSTDDPKAGTFANTQKNVTKTTDQDNTMETISNASEEDDVKDVDVAYQSLNSQSAESSVMELRSNRKIQPAVDRKRGGILGGFFLRRRGEKSNTAATSTAH